MALTLALMYMVLLGATYIGELSPEVALLNAAVAAPVLVIYLTRAPRLADGFDKLTLVAVLLFIGSCMLSTLPRMSFEPALAAVTFAAALFVARGVFRWDPNRIALGWTLILLSAVLTALTALRWGEYLTEWLALTGWQSAPPLNMELPAFPWSHRHDLALLVTMLYPAWWIGRPSAIRKAAAVVVGLLVLFVVVVDGSRTLWLAIVLGGMASLVLAAVRRAPALARMGDRRIWILVLAASVTLAGLFVVSGVAGALIERLTNFESVGWRTAMWGALVDSWLAHPAAGSGPGTFPWLLQQTPYFDSSSFAPRHPDSAPIQALAESGLIGIAAIAILVGAVSRGLIQRNQRAATFALTTFAVASIASNPTDFAFMVIAAIAWVAYALPREQSAMAAPEEKRPSSPGFAFARLGLLSVVGLAWFATCFAAISYADARRAVGRDELSRAGDALERATALDPGMALYRRQLGTLHYALGDLDRAAGELRAAAMLNPSDDLAWRVLALVASVEGDVERRRAALGEAIRLQRSDPSNLVLSARWGLASDETDAAFETLAEVVQAWPSIVYSPAWDGLISTAPFDTATVVQRAYDRWNDGVAKPEMVEDQGLWLEAMTGIRTPSQMAIEEAGTTRELAEVMSALMACRLTDPSFMQNVQAPNRLYWQLRSRDGALRQTGDRVPQDVLELTTRRTMTLDDMNPTNGNGVRGMSGDQWGYRRPPIDWPAIDPLLPSPRAGETIWLTARDC